jgi:hypothetical protein
MCQSPLVTQQRARGFPRVCLLAFAVCTATSFALRHRLAVCQDTNLRERFREEAPGAWSEYRSFLGRLQGSHRLQVVSHKDNEVINDYYMDYKQADGCFSWNYREQPKSGEAAGPEDVAVINPSYAFEVTRSTTDSQWALAELSLRRGERLPPKIGVMIEIAKRRLDVALSVCQVPLPDIVKSPTFTLRGVSLVERGDEELVRVEYEYQQPRMANGKIDGNRPGGGGWVLLDPQRHWIVREFDVAAVWRDGKDGPASKGRVTGIYQTVDAPQGFPIVKRYAEHRMASETGEPPFIADIEEVQDYGLHYDANVPPSEFTVSAFGLPEPSSDARPRTPFWLGILGVACIVIAVLLLLRKKWRSEPVTP